MRKGFADFFASKDVGVTPSENMPAVESLMK
jgi:hypothetical protein